MPRRPHPENRYDRARAGLTRIVEFCESGLGDLSGYRATASLSMEHSIPHRSHFVRLGALVSLAFAFGVVPALFSQTSTGTAERIIGGPVSADVSAELKLIADARNAIKAKDEKTSDARLAAEEGLASRGVTRALFAKRVAGVCGWLLNENEYGEAMKLARRSIARMKSMRDDSDADSVDRLYWEAWLEAEILDHRLRAIELLQAAEKIAPKDERVLEALQRWVATVAEFGAGKSSEEVKP